MKTAFLYAGQGSQHPGMGKDLYDTFPEFRNAFDAAPLDFDLHRLCFEDPDQKLMQTEYTQPCMVAFASGVTAVLQKMGISADYAAGLSLGEYSALEAAGVFNAKTAIRTVSFRGKAMEKASRGIDCEMVAVLGLDEAALNRCCSEAASLSGKVVSICNYNCPGQLVIGGEKAAVESAAALAKEAGAARCIPLSVSGPFHTSLMKPAGDALSEYFSHMTFQEMKFPVLFNCLGKENSENLSLSELLVRQVQSSVRMEDIIRRMFELGVTDFIEIGPGRALSGFVKKTAKAMGITEYVCHTIETADEILALSAKK